MINNSQSPAINVRKTNNTDEDSCTPSEIINRPILSPISDVKGFSIANLNIRSLPHKLDQLRLLLLDHPIDVLSLNETFLTADFNDDDMFIPGYSIFRNDRGSRHGGGVAMYVRDNLSVNIVTCTGNFRNSAHPSEHPMGVY